MSFFLKFVGGTLIVLSVISLILYTVLSLAGAVWLAEEGHTGAAAWLAGFGWLYAVVCVAGLMALGAVLYVGGRALDYMGPTRQRRPVRGKRRPRKRYRSSR